MKFLNLVCFVSSIAVVLGGNCLTDGNTNQPSSAWNTRLWSYSPSSAGTISSSSTLSFMSYNLQSSISASCKSNAPTQAGYMNTDFVGNQEVAQGIDTRCNCNMPKIIADTAKKSTRFVMTFPWRTGQYGIGLGTAQTILDTKYYLYQYSGAEQRALVAVKTKPPGLNGKALWFISTHLDYTVWAARQAQASQLIQWVRDNIVSQDSTASVVVVGDFNGGPDDQFYRTLKGFFKNAWEVYSGSTAGGLTYPAGGPSVRFDHIWYYTPSSVSAQVTSVEVVNTQASDHRPLKAYIKFTTSGSAPSIPAPTKAPTPAPTKAATSAPTKGATSAPAPATPAPTKAATSAPSSSGSCSVSLDFNLLGNFISIRNTGSKPIKALELTFSPSVPSNNWNLLSTSSSNVKTLPDFAYQSLGVGQTYSSSGFWTAGSKPTITATRVTC